MPKSNPIPESGPAGASAGRQHRSMHRYRFLFPLMLAGFCLLLPTLGGMVGYRLAGRKAAQEDDWQAPGNLLEYVQEIRQSETMAGAFVIDRVSLEGVEKCYYDESVDFTQIVWAGRDMPTPFLGYAPQPGLLPGGRINRQQFRYHRDLDIPKSAGTCRIFVIGGSTAFGSGASTNQTTVGGYLELLYLNEQAKKYGCRFEVVTAASCGWASSHERILVENRLMELEPDVVLALSGYNDVFCGMMRFDVNCFRAIQDSYYLWLSNALLKSNFDDSFPPSLKDWRQPVSADQTAVRLQRNVDLSHGALNKVGADYCFVLQPSLSCSHKVRTPREQRMASRPTGMGTVANEAELMERYDKCRTALSRLKLPHYSFWDLTGVFDSDGSDMFIDRCHFGDRGHDVIARRLRDLLAPVLQARLKRAGR